MKKILFSFVLVGLLFLCPLVSATNPDVTNVEPDDETINYETLVNIQADIMDTDNDLKKIHVYLFTDDNEIDSWSSPTLSENTTYYALNHIFEGLTPGLDYTFDISVLDYANNWTNNSYSFTTDGEYGEDDDDEKIKIIPSKPKAGKNVIFLLDETEEEAGYVYCEDSGNVYFVDVKDGMGFVELDMEFGNATVVFPDYGNKNFKFANPYEGEIDISMPSVAELNERMPISVYVAGEQTSVTLTFTSPTGKKMSRVTNTDNPIEMAFDISGNWSVVAEINGATATYDFFINPEPIDIDMPQRIFAGEETEINVNTKANVIITKDETTWTYESDDEGLVYFTPPWAGRYKIEAKTDSQEGTEYFMAQSDTEILLRNEEGSLVNKLSKGDTVLIQVADSQGNLVSSNDLTVMADGSPLKRIQLLSGSTIWKVPVDASSYTFNFNTEKQTLKSSTLTVEGGKEPVQSGINPVGIGALIFIIIIFVLYALHKFDYIDLSFITEYNPFSTSSDLIEEDELF